jgi:hypothetical protein
MVLLSVIRLAALAAGILLMESPAHDKSRVRRRPEKTPEMISRIWT